MPGRSLVERLDRAVVGDDTAEVAHDDGAQVAHGRLHVACGGGGGGASRGGRWVSGGRVRGVGETWRKRRGGAGWCPQLASVGAAPKGVQGGAMNPARGSGTFTETFLCVANSLARWGGSESTLPPPQARSRPAQQGETLVAIGPLRRARLARQAC